MFVFPYTMKRYLEKKESQVCERRENFQKKKITHFRHQVEHGRCGASGEEPPDNTHDVWKESLHGWTTSVENALDQSRTDIVQFVRLRVANLEDTGDMKVRQKLRPETSHGIVDHHVDGQANFYRFRANGLKEPREQTKNGR